MSGARRVGRLISGSGPALALGRAALGALGQDRGALRACARALLARLQPDELAAEVIHRLRHAPPVERAAIDAALEGALRVDDQTLAYALENARGKLLAMRAAGAAPEARILELGAGASLAAGLLYWVHGARGYTAIDMVPPLLEAGHYRRLRARLGEVPPAPLPGFAAAAAAAQARFDQAVDLRGPEAVFRAGTVEVRWPVDAAALPFPDRSFELVLSNAALEHFQDPRAAIAETFRVLAPGGLGLHQIDLRDHRDFARPREFLRESAPAWQARIDRDGVELTNRWRRGDFARAFQAAGFELLACDVTTRHPLQPGEREGLAPPFCDLPADELEAVCVHLTVRRP